MFFQALGNLMFTPGEKMTKTAKATTKKTVTTTTTIIIIRTIWNLTKIIRVSAFKSTILKVLALQHNELYLSILE